MQAQRGEKEGSKAPVALQDDAGPAEAIVEGRVLLVKHVPDSLSPSTVERLFGHYGATAVRKVRQRYFVEFAEAGQAAQAQRQLHRVRFMNKVLSVETAQTRAPPSSQEGPAPSPAAQAQPAGLPPTASADAYVAEGARTASCGRVSTDGAAAAAPLRPPGEPIAPSLGVSYPFPPHLRYAYPPPDGNILTNIINTLIAVPRFYTQVLHLMNKMNLPVPFAAARPTPPLPQPAPPPPPPPIPEAPPDALAPRSAAGDLSSSESELESPKAQGADKELRAQVANTAGPEPPMPAGESGPPPPGAARERVAQPASRPFSVRKRAPVLTIKLGEPKKARKDAVGEAPVTEAEPPTAQASAGEGEEVKKRATRHALLANRMAAHEILRLPRFQDYSAGEPNQVLYIKNLASSVTDDDLLFIYSAYFPTRAEAEAVLKIRVMQEGRMRGQAFVTFPSVELADTALRETHGYLQSTDKPMVVSFGRRSGSK